MSRWKTQRERDERKHERKQLAQLDEELRRREERIAALPTHIDTDDGPIYLRFRETPDHFPPSDGRHGA